MNILVAGADGFVGIGITKELISRGHHIRALSRSPNKHAEFEQVTADVTKPETLRGLAEGMDAVIYLPGLLREFPSKGITFESVHVDGVKNLAAEAHRAGAKRWIQMSALGVERGIRSKYFQTKLKAEIFLMDDRQLEVTIIRPSLIAPDEPTSEANFVTDLLARTRILPFFPVLGNGLYRMQPIARGDVARAFANGLENNDTIGRTFELGGPDQLTMNQIVAILKREAGISKPAVHIPLLFIRPLAAMLKNYAFFPVTPDQITMLISENIVTRAHIGDTSVLLRTEKRTSFSDAVRNYFC